MDKDQIYLEEIKEFCGKILFFISEKDFADFLADEKLQLAIVKLIENVGEAAKRLSQRERDNKSHIPWKKVMAMRDRLVHDYMDVDLTIVYDVAINEIATLLDTLQAR